jgi:hypothetical protein
VAAFLAHHLLRHPLVAAFLALRLHFLLDCLVHLLRDQPLDLDLVRSSQLPPREVFLVLRRRERVCLDRQRLLQEVSLELLLLRHQPRVSLELLLLRHLHLVDLDRRLT